MPPTPLFPGEPTSPRDEEPRWFEPVDAATEALVEPTVAESDWLASEASERARDQVAWRDLRWVEFGDPEEPAPDDAGAATVEPISPPSRAAPEPQPPVASGADALAASDGLDVTVAEQPGNLRRRFVAGIGRLLRFGAAAVSLVVLAIFLYHGGEMLAGFAGAMTRPSAPPEPPPATAASAVPDRLALPEASRLAPARGGAVDRRAADYLDRARAGEPSAQYNLAVLYALGDGVAQDYASAASWFRQAAENGNPAAQFNLGVLYERGLGVSPDGEAAVSWYRRAAERGYPAAEYNLALAYAEGRGTGQNVAAAARWYHDAAVQGVVPAMVNVAILYETGEGVTRSPPDAYAWYRAAARRGDAAAGERALALFQQLTGADKGRAVLMAAAVAEAMLEPLPPLPSAAGPGGPPTVLKPAAPSSSSRPRDASPARRQPAG